MGDNKKRKRNASTQDADELPQPKVQILENRDSVSRTGKSEQKSGEHRQMKSERKRKSRVQAKLDASRGKADHAEEITLSKDMNMDDLGAGKDFVPLDGNGSHDKRAKGRSPRSIRKEAKQKKDKGDTNVTGSAKDEKSGSGANARFICFVGNLPYTATSEQIAAHFQKIQPQAIRLRTDKATGKSKGFAFLEFNDFDKMKTCLKMYHHSIFEPEQIEPTAQERSKASQQSKTSGRKINVELTAGGGGKSTSRRDKITEKNKKLDLERARDWEKKKQQEAEKSRNPRNGKNVQHRSGPNSEPTNDSTDRGSIHPSRMNRVRG